MALFSQNDYESGDGRRLTGFARYREILERDVKRFFTVNLWTLLGFAPFGLGVWLSILSSSILILIPSCIIGGAIAGPALSCMYDAVFRSLRDAPGRCMENYRRAWRQNWRQAVLPGIVFCLMIGFYAFMMMMFLWSGRFPGLGTLAVYIIGLVLITMFFTVYWPLLVLFEQTGTQRFKNCILFMIRVFARTLGCSLLQILYWLAIFLLLPLSVIALPFIGFWFILFVSNFLLYDTFNELFGIEEKIAEAFPEQAAFYEDDEAWLKRRQKEQQEEKRRQEKD